ncbi:DUF2971 domain-containing protein [Pseudomonas sichuanensis]|uniref:DUF2971 domain-containing protein n=1 Tax=Pseudomonas sichuanensis TaxID=2213015 RepID=UPI00244D5621|nr:DUF2971 domain-containing protein [Pseudomonas sichuanensis]MDH0729213.1 DUF2971 domain-containing protein [Pseudomonas sichuanensis]MDH1581415.1 DUF2971 domain-containing protein [Pseudomonas sichuanensis]MDH1593885.1 DUF2971 domain-containing protein [Pseudomonas sichuanensis]MDH1600005.1 DUF2971 domain-containing protein [Pseudomonas sichuanensis]
MAILYHYTDVNGFFNILKNKKLWLSGPHNLNDHQELQWTYRKVQDILMGIQGEYAAEHVNFLWELFCRNQYIPFTCSLSAEGDILSQWRAYAKDGTGVAIGFDSDLLPLVGHHPRRMHSYVSTMQVLYDSAPQDSIIERIIRNALDDMKSNGAQSEVALDAAMYLQGLSTFYKNGAFQEEKEWRIIHIPLIWGFLNTNQTTVQSAVSELKHRASGNKLVSYFEYDLSSLVSDFGVRKIVLGPKCEISNYDLELFLTINGYEKTEVVRSLASYR